MSLRRVDELLQTHFAETSDVLVDKAPSTLRRGEGTEKAFFIMKVDLVGSTALLWNRRQATYLKLAHTFLSTVDRITQDYGADADQVEYAGDGLFTYFPATAGASEKVLCAAFYAKAAVDRMGNLGGAVGALKPRCRIVLHYDMLTVARIGPRENSILAAIGTPLHKVAKLEKDISPGVGRATIEFRAQLDRQLWKYLDSVYAEERVPVAPAPVMFPSETERLGITLAALARGGSTPTPPSSFASELSKSTFPSAPPNGLFALAGAPRLPPPAFQIVKKVIGYDLLWGMLGRDLK